MEKYVVKLVFMFSVLKPKIKGFVKQKLRKIDKFENFEVL